jgi:RNA polymerase sigma-70 factor (ECF subfamily)
VVFVACGDADVAEDAAAEAFTRALDHWDRVQAMVSPEAWVCRVAVNVMRRRVRRRRVERRLLGRRVVSPLGEGDVLPEVWVAVRALPQRQRLAILLRYVADLTEAEAAAVMGVSRGAVSASLSAARAHLAVSLAAFDDLGDREVPYA